VETYGTAGQATDENTILSRKDVFFVLETKARIQTHTYNFLYLFLFNGNNVT